MCCYQTVDGSPPDTSPKSRLKELLTETQMKSQHPHLLWFYEVMISLEILYKELDLPSKYKLMSLFVSHEHTDSSLLQATFHCSTHMIKSVQQHVKDSGRFKTRDRKTQSSFRFSDNEESGDEEQDDFEPASLPSSSSSSSRKKRKKKKRASPLPPNKNRKIDSDRLTTTPPKSTPTESTPVSVSDWHPPPPPEPPTSPQIPSAARQRSSAASRRPPSRQARQVPDEPGGSKTIDMTEDGAVVGGVISPPGVTLDPGPAESEHSSVLERKFTDWTEDDVGSWLKTLPFGKPYVDVFREKSVNGIVLQTLSAQMLERIFQMKYAHILQFRKVVQRLLLSHSKKEVG